MTHTVDMDLSWWSTILHSTPALPDIVRFQDRAKGISLVPQQHSTFWNERYADLFLSGDAVLVYPDLQHGVLQPWKDEAGPADLSKFATRPTSYTRKSGKKPTSAKRTNAVED
jgi:hypothetical protein